MDEESAYLCVKSQFRAWGRAEKENHFESSELIQKQLFYWQQMGWSAEQTRVRSETVSDNAALQFNNW